MSRFRILAITAILVGAPTVAAWLCFVGMHVGRHAFELDERLRTPESVEQTKTFLATVESRLDTLPQTDSQSAEMEMVELSAGVYQRAIEHPELPEVWTTAAAVINRRSRHDTKRVMAACEEDSIARPRIESPDKFESIALTTYKNCAISLGGDDRARKRNRRDPARDLRREAMELKDVHVTYRGGPLPSIAIFSCVRCTFDVQLRGIPPVRGKSFIRGLLMAYSENFSIEISDYSPQKEPPH